MGFCARRQERLALEDRICKRTCHLPLELSGVWRKWALLQIGLVFPCVSQIWQRRDWGLFRSILPFCMRFDSGKYMEEGLEMEKNPDADEDEDEDGEKMEVERKWRCF